MRAGFLTRALTALLLGGTLSAPVAAQLPLIFHDSFQSGDACAWSFTGAGDPCQAARLYAQTGQNLYRVNAVTGDATLVGAFATGGPSITDIAIDRNDTILGISAAALWWIDGSTGAATSIAPFDATGGLNSLSFVADDAHPLAAERLVTAGDSGAVYAIDRNTGALTLLGNYGFSGGMQIRSAGDLVSVYGVGTFAMVNLGDTATDPDYLATVDTTTWAATPIGNTSTASDRVNGLGFWDGQLYGFVDDGSGAGTGTVIAIDSGTGAGSQLQTASLRWLGAGVSTKAPAGD
jgi:hypothetical protein